MTANYTDTGIDLEIHETATRTSLIWLRERVQSHIDAMTTTLAETIQAGPVQVVESEHRWSPWFDWSGGENPVPGCKVKVDAGGGAVRFPLDGSESEMFEWTYFFKKYKVLISSIPEGYTLSDKGVLRGVPKADWPDWRRGLTLPDGYVWAGFGDGGDIVDTSLCVHECMGLSVISKAGGCLKGVLYALPTNAPQEHFDRFTGDRA